MANSNTQSSHKETAEQSKKESEIFKQIFDSTEGTYEVKAKAAQEAVTKFQEADAKFRRTMLGEKFRNQTAQLLAGPAPMPEIGGISPELTSLSNEKVATWLEQHQGSLRGALTSMFNLGPKFQMNDIEWAKFLGELQNADNRNHKIFFALDDWLTKAETLADQKPVADKKGVVANILAKIEQNQSPLDTTLERAA